MEAPMAEFGGIVLTSGPWVGGGGEGMGAPAGGEGGGLKKSSASVSLETTS